jgi:Kdo2-lipid IVA lauroyltransferase/acyltransferase
VKQINILLGYLFVYPILWLLSLLPLELLFRLSNVVFFLVYKTFKYRVDVVRSNLKNAFPEKSEVEIIEIERSFYLYLCDFIMETIKGISISEAECHRRYTVTDKAKLQISAYLQKQQSIILTLGHYGNWELGGAIFGAASGMFVNVIYRPLSSPFTEIVMRNIRMRFGNLTVPMNDIFKVMLEDKKAQKVRATAFAIDQAAPPESAYWTIFLNQESSVFLGAEKLAAKFNYPVIHVYSKRIKRGYYEITTKLLHETPKDLKAGELSEIITKDIERVIVKDPAYWLWSHRRWKHKREDKHLNTRLPSNLD